MLLRYWFVSENTYRNNLTENNFLEENWIHQHDKITPTKIKSCRNNFKQLLSAGYHLVNILISNFLSNSNIWIRKTWEHRDYHEQLLVFIITQRNYSFAYGNKIKFSFLTQHIFLNISVSYMISLQELMTSQTHDISLNVQDFYDSIKLWKRGRGFMLSRNKR